MQLIGMLDSPFVRRSFIVAQRLGIALEHRPLSVFRNFAEFHAINPLVRAPTLILDDGSCLVDSGLIVEHLMSLAPDGRLLPGDPAGRLLCRQLTGLGLSMCDKAVQLYYELGVRPQTLRWPEWITRCTAQLRDNAAMLEQHCECPEGWLQGDVPRLSDITVAVAWRFTHHVLPHILDPNEYPRLGALGDRAEALPEFVAADFE
ncbi:MAG: glutathione S-transferase family protein [Rhodocyclaceae bacterium]|nr:glutathione S-transferase family protein [Rhodocyclaceae bacterium]